MPIVKPSSTPDKVSDAVTELLMLIDEYAGTAADAAWVARHGTVLEYNISVNLKADARNNCIAALVKHFPYSVGT